MPDDRCFRIDDLDVDELRDQTRNQQLIDAFSQWVEHFAPKVDEVVSEISIAFANTKLDDGIGLFQANGLDDYASASELKQLRNCDEKNDWRKISHSDLERCNAAPSFFDAKGFIFHLPAFLIAELNDRHPYGFIDRLFRTEEHPEGWRMILTEDQRRAIISTLKLIRQYPNYEHDRNEIDWAIQNLNVAPEIG